ncbi:MAG: hypothetical protein KDA21_04660, partial [Phycisphaerales bacterium]|nr:hypothetical protein [Phycisphaerales bacterium]
MSDTSVPAMAGTEYHRDNPLLRSKAGLIGMCVLGVLVGVCLLSIPYTFGEVRPDTPRYDHQRLAAFMLPPWWVTHDEAEKGRLEEAARQIATERIRSGYLEEHELEALPDGVELPEPTAEQVSAARPRYWLGTDSLGRPLLTRCLAGGGISIGIGLSAAAISVFIGTLYGAIAGYLGGKPDAVMMRIVDILYGLPYILLVVLLAVAG